MAMVSHPLTGAAEGWPDASHFVDDEVEWREWVCPGCGVRLAAEVGYPGEASFAEIRIDS
jgi:hypothetical protein